MRVITIDQADLPDATREDIAHRNAERLMPGLA
jgi:hypothetical protein